MRALSARSDGVGAYRCILSSSLRVQIRGTLRAWTARQASAGTSQVQT
jgi:hypothetical protein